MSKAIKHYGMKCEICGSLIDVKLNKKTDEIICDSCDMDAVANSLITSNLNTEKEIKEFASMFHISLEAIQDNPIIKN